MKAVVARAGLLGVEDRDEPIPGPGQVLVKPLACGVCGSDVHLLHTQASMPDVVPPMVMGHEFVGEILDYGPGTDRILKPGTMVTSVPYLDDPAGAQLIGVSPVAPGALAQRMLLQESRLLAVPAELPAKYAALAEPLAVGTHAVDIAGMRDGDAALVIGCGPVGLAVIAALKAAGHAPVVAADFSAARRELAAATGAHTVIDPETTSPYAAWAELAGPQVPASPLIIGEQHPATVVFECVGAPGVLDTVIGSVPAHTRVVVVGVCQQPDTITPAVAIMKELTLTFSYAYRPREFAQSRQGIADGRLPASELVTAELPLQRTPDAFAELSGPSAQGKILIMP